jgi:hypothetical protein
MIPTVGDTVIICFKNGLKIDGEVHQWSSKEVILKSLSGSSHIIIPDITQEVLLYKISNTKKDFNAIKDKIDKTPEDIVALADLKKELIELEQEEVRAKLSEHSITETKPINYGLPNISQIKIAPERAREETPRKNINFSTELQNMFSKKYQNS